MTHSNTNPQPGQYLTHAHSHITRALAAMDSCFGLVIPHQQGSAVGAKSGGQPAYHRPFTTEAGVKHSFKRQLHSTHVVAVGWFI